MVDPSWFEKAVEAGAQVIEGFHYWFLCAPRKADIVSVRKCDGLLKRGKIEEQLEGRLEEKQLQILAFWKRVPSLHAGKDLV